VQHRSKPTRGRTLKEDPSAAPWPELADISISNHCTEGCDFCYRGSSPNQEFMSLSDYRFVLSQLANRRWGNVFQVALGGGEPLEHPCLFEILDTTVQFRVVPNLTTNGKHLTSAVARHLAGRVGAVALSVSDLETCNHTAIEHLTSAGIKTNLHFLLRKRSVQQAIQILDGQYDDMLAEINAVIFLTYKAAGRASLLDRLHWDEDLRAFVRAIDPARSTVRFGFDACFVPLLLHATQVDRRLIDPCECGFFSIYIDENLNVKPCSFTTGSSHCFSLREMGVEQIWTEALEEYRESVSNACQRQCMARAACRGACPYFPEVNFCFSPERSDALS
jgi:radical SAM protein with 4Fe4S-binding SPASM domain